MIELHCFEFYTGWLWTNEKGDAQFDRKSGHKPDLPE